MKRVIKSIWALIIIGYICVLPMEKAWATNAQIINDEKMVTSARAIVTGRVTHIESQWDATRNQIYTYITVALTQVLKGNITTNTVVVEQIGGRLGGRQSWLVGSPEFRLGEEVLLFLNNNAQGVLHTAHLSMGKFSFTDNANSLTRTPRLNSSNKLNTHQYLQYIQTLLKEKPSSSSEQVQLQPIPPHYLAGKGELQDNFAFLNGRFFQPDTAQPVTFSINPKNAPVNGGGVLETNNAIKAWNNAGSQLRLVNTGSTSSCGIKMDQQSVISFGDCDDILDDPVDDQGVISGVMFFTGDDFRMLSGNKLNQIMEADIVFNNGFDDLLKVSSNLEELITHALGNAFGLDNNSTDPNEPDATLREAIMFFIPHLDGRGARLNTDDQSGVSQLYPLFNLVQIRNTMLATPIIKVAYLQNLLATGGFPPYTFQLTNGNLPDGLMLSDDGTISGTPNNVETASFEVMVTDSGNFRATRSITLNVVALPPKIFSSSLGRTCYNRMVKITINGTGFLGTTAVNVSNSNVSLLGFNLIDDNTIEVMLSAASQTNVLTDITVVNPAGTATLPSALLFTGPQLLKGRIGTVINDKGKEVRGIIIIGQGLGFDQQLKVMGTLTTLPVTRNEAGNLIFFGKIGNIIPKKGEFPVTIIDPNLDNCESNEISIPRARSK